ncbi:MAG: hypothetical protein QXT81_01495 [Candidatus Bathyarchaeia archaeon]
MELESKVRKAEPEHVSSYQDFKEWLKGSAHESELRLLQQYHAATRLLKQGMQEVYINTPVRFLPDGLKRFVDACGLGDDKFTTILCEAGVADDSLELLELLGRSSNVEEIWVYPLFDRGLEILKRAAEPHSRRKIRFEKGTLEHLEDFFEGALEALDLFESEARMRMLFAMLESPRDKRFLREIVNPKLLYENLATLQRMRLIEEVSRGTFALSIHGERLMHEYLLFLDRVRRSIRDLKLQEPEG